MLCAAARHLLLRRTPSIAPLLRQYASSTRSSAHSQEKPLFPAALLQRIAEFRESAPAADLGRVSPILLELDSLLEEDGSLLELIKESPELAEEALKDRSSLEKRAEGVVEDLLPHLIGKFVQL